MKRPGCRRIPVESQVSRSVFKAIVALEGPMKAICNRRKCMMHIIVSHTLRAIPSELGVSVRKTSEMKFEFF